MSVNSEEFVHNYANRMAPFSQRQTPVYSQAGKGLRGDSAAIAYEQDGVDSKLQGLYLNQMTGEVSTLWEIPLTDLVPMLHYEVWRGVREIDGVNMWGYYIKYTNDITINGSTQVLWTFQTPFVATHPFNGANVPGDYKIDSDEE